MSAVRSIFVIVGLLSIGVESGQAMCGGMFIPEPPRINLGQKKHRATITNKATKVALVRDGNLTVMTMSNDFKGDVTEFALVVPVPTLIKRHQVRVGEHTIFEDLENLTNPQLTEKYDPSPCPMLMATTMSAPSMQAESHGGALSKQARSKPKAAKYGVKVEAHYVVGEYGIAILKAKRGKGLTEWLNKFKYNIPKRAIPILNSYIKQGFRFFVARVNLKNQKKSGFNFLRPLQVSYKTDKFGLPIRLGMVNASGPQELEVYGISSKGRIEAANYRTVKMPTDRDLPLYVRDQFGKFLEALFKQQTTLNGMRVLFNEYTQPGALTAAQLKTLGFPWARKDVLDPQGASKYVLTKLHFRYQQSTFPEDLVLNETPDRIPFRINFNVRHRSNQLSCNEARNYLTQLASRRETEATQLAQLTGWPQEEIRDTMGLRVIGSAPPAHQEPPEPPKRIQTPEKEKNKKSWWEKLF